MGKRPRDAAAHSIAGQRRRVEIVAREDRRRLSAIGCGGVPTTPVSSDAMPKPEHRRRAIVDVVVDRRTISIEPEHRRRTVRRPSRIEPDHHPATAPAE